MLPTYLPTYRTYPLQAQPQLSWGSPKTMGHGTGLQWIQVGWSLLVLSGY
jgi:hypothetical protein